MSQLMADDGTPKDVNLHRDPSTAISVGVQCDSVDLQYDSLGVQCDYIGVRYDSLGVQCDYIGMRYDSIGVQCDYIGVRYDSIGVQCDSNEESIIQLSGSHSTPDRKVQTNIEGQDTLSMDDDNYVMYEPAVELDCDNSLHNEYQLNENYDAWISSSVNSDVSDSSSSGCNQSNSHETLQEIPIPISPPLKSRLRQNPRAVVEKTPAGSYLRQGSSKPGRPVVFATQRPVVTAKAKGGVKQDLVCESQTGGGNVTPFISSFLMDSDGMEFVRSTISSRHDSWLCIARHIASLLRRECLSGAMKRMACSLMSFDIWIKDVSIECKNALCNETGDTVLPPLAHCVIIELSARAQLDEKSLRSLLHNIWVNCLVHKCIIHTKDNAKCVTEVLRYLLHAYKRGGTDLYSPGFKILASVMAERSGPLPGHGDICTQ
ncbi:hypothetical protein F4604DRAFT_1690675 [Suillus subluteus]|nr:hypothetical protein F4604DRAFT_1690675 [Suillus subluteus]